MKKLFFLSALAVVLTAFSARAEIATTKHLVSAPPPFGEPAGYVTPDGTFNIREPDAPFYSPRLADALGLDEAGRFPSGDFPDLNRGIYTRYRVSGQVPSAILVLMPGTWAGALSMDIFARHLLTLAEKQGVAGLEVWLVDRRSELLEDHVGLWWGMEKEAPIEDRLTGISDYYRPAFEKEGVGIELMGRRHVPLNHDDVRFLAGNGGDTTIRDWRAVVLAAHRLLGNEIEANDAGVPLVKKQPGKRVFIGGHSLGGSLTVLYAAYDFDRRPGREVLGMDDVDGLVLLEGGGFKMEPPKTESADKYMKSVLDRYQKGMVYFDMDMLGIRYAPSTMLSLAISGFAAHMAPGVESTFPDYARPAVVRLPHATNRAVLGFAIDDDVAPFFIARVSIGHPSGEWGMGGQLRAKSITVPMDPNECPLITAWLPGHRAMDPDYLYDWNNIDDGRHPAAGSAFYRGCENDVPEVTDFTEFARSLYSGPTTYEGESDLSRGPNDFAEWYFPPRLSTDSRYLGARVVDDDGAELISAAHGMEVDLPVIAFYGDDSMGEFRLPELNEKNFPPGVLAHEATAVKLILGYTHLDITAATRNFQPDLAGDSRNYNACAVYTMRFLSKVAGW